MLRALPVLLVALALSGCSEVDPGLTDFDRVVGSWQARTANVRVQTVPVGLPVASLGGDEQTFTFREDETFAFRFVPAPGRTLRLTVSGSVVFEIPVTQTVNLSGTFRVDESADRILLSTVAGSTADDFRLGYGFGLTGAGLELIAEDAQVLAVLLGLAPDDAAILASAVTGGSISYSRG